MTRASSRSAAAFAGGGGLCGRVFAMYALLRERAQENCAIALPHGGNCADARRVGEG